MSTLNDIWARTLELLRIKLNNPASMNAWINQIQLVKLTGESAVMSVPTRVHWDIITYRFSSTIKECLCTVLGFDNLEVSFIIDDTVKEPEKPTPEKTLDVLPIKPINEEYTFENYVVGNSNRLAHAACQAVANNPGKAYNPLFIYGGSGLGKTHLMYSIINVVKKSDPYANVLYISCEDFTNELVASLKNASMEDFRAKYRKLDLLVVDDIQFIGGKEQTQEEFFHTFETLYLAGKQIVIASDRPPREIQSLSDRVRSRFESDLQADIQIPDYELRMAIIRKKAEALSLNLPDSVVDFLASKLKYNVRQIEGALKKILALSLISKNPPGISSAQSAVADILNTNEPIESVIDRIITAVAHYYSVSVDDIKGNKRVSNISSARQVCMYIIREVCSISLPQIGEYFGGKDHSTVHHSISKIEERCRANSSFKNEMNDLINSIKKK